MSSAFRPARLAAAAAAACLAAGLLPGCNDNIACVYGGGCDSDDSGSNGQGLPATLPEDGWWIESAPPGIERTFPQGMGRGPRTPIGLVFSESMNAQGLTGFFEVVARNPLGGGMDVPVPLSAEALVGDGRVLLLIPASSMPDGEVRVLVSMDAEDDPTDVTGQPLSLASGAQVASFTVDAMTATEPVVAGTWPDEGDTGQSPIGEIVVAFDRAINALTVTDASFDVRVNGLPPANDPVAQPLQIQLLGTTTPEPRVFLYRSVDPLGSPVPLGQDADVDVSLSPMTGMEIEDAMGVPLQPTSFSFRTSPLSLPLDVRIASQPSDAVGLSNLTTGSPDELSIEVDLADGLPGDRVDLFLFGTSLDEEDPHLIALQRTLELVDTGMTPIQLATFTLADINLVRQGAGISARFEDGRLAAAVRLRRGSNETTLKVLDVDPLEDGIQDAVLDTQPPTVQELLDAGGGTSFYRSDEREVTFAGHADEVLRAAEVVLTLPGGSMLSNGTRPPVVGSGEGGLFVTAPVTMDPGNPFGFLTGTATYTLVVYDEALNSSAVATGTFTQLGVVGTTPLAAGGTLDVQVFDALTLAPLPGATVLSHADAGDGVNFPSLGSGTTGPTGLATGLPAHSAGQVGTLITVDLPGYDLFTFHGVPTTFLSVPLVRAGSALGATVSGVVSTPSPLAFLSLNTLDRVVADSRRPPQEVAFYGTASCSPVFSGETGCPFGPEPILPLRIGAQSFLAGLFGITEPSFSAAALIQAFDLLLPVQPTPAGAPDTTTSSFPRMLSVLDGATVEELPVELPPVALIADLLGLMGIEVNRPDDDPDTTGIPRCHVEALVPGLPATVPVGLALAFEQGPGIWRVRSAVPGAVTPVGSFGASVAIDPDLFLSLELRDLDGAVSLRRRRLSGLAGLPVLSGLPSLVIQDVPTLVQPPAGGSVTGSSYTVEFPDTIPDAEDGLYRVELSEPGVGRGWTLWKLDVPGSANVEVRLPDLQALGRTPLVDGMLTAVLTAFSVPGLDTSAFLWADLAREVDILARSELQMYVQLP